MSFNPVRKLIDLEIPDFAASVNQLAMIQYARENLRRVNKANALWASLDLQDLPSLVEELRMLAACDVAPVYEQRVSAKQAKVDDVLKEL